MNLNGENITEYNSVKVKSVVKENEADDIEDDDVASTHDDLWSIPKGIVNIEKMNAGKEDNAQDSMDEAELNTSMKITDDDEVK